MLSNVILSALGFIPSPPTLVNKTDTTITFSWIPVHLMLMDMQSLQLVTHTLCVKGGSQNDMTLNSFHGDPCNTCTCTIRYYNQFIEVTNDCCKYNNNIQMTSLVTIFKYICVCVCVCVTSFISKCSCTSYITCWYFICIYKVDVREMIKKLISKVKKFATFHGQYIIDFLMWSENGQI